MLEIITHTPPDLRYPTPLLFVHGAWHNAACWEYMLPYVAQQGYAATAFSLRGHGASAGHERLRWNSINDYVADLAQIIQTLPRPPILIGHSMGGYIVQKYLETASVPAAILLASIPVMGVRGFMLRYIPQHPWLALKAHLLLNPWHIVGTPARMTEAFFSPDTDPATLARQWARLQSESIRIELDALVLNLPRPNKVTTPLLVMGAAQDRIFSIAEVQATARAYGTEAIIIPNMAHDMMLEAGWQPLTDRMLAWLHERGL